MDLKQKFKNLKSKIEDNADEILTATYVVCGVVAIALTTYYRNELQKSQANHQECHDFTEWVVNKTRDGEVKSIWQEERGSDGFIHIRKLNEMKDVA